MKLFDTERALRFCGCFIFLFISVVVSGCSSMQQAQTPAYTVQIDEPQRIRFSGKGAGAGMMMMSSMGPMGIAIGVAIDEGIAKSIQEQFTLKGHSLELLLNVAVKEALADTNQRNKQKETKQTHPKTLSIHLHRIGVKMAADEKVIADIEGEIGIDGSVTPVKFATKNESSDLPSVTLEQIKADGDLTYALLKDALVKSIQAALLS